MMLAFLLFREERQIGFKGVGHRSMREWRSENTKSEKADENERDDCAAPSVPASGRRRWRREAKNRGNNE